MASPPPSQPATRRDELLQLAAAMFAERGLKATTVRDIADSAGILSGSLYHHLKSKEQMVEEVMRDFLDWLFARYEQIIATEPDPLARFKGLFMASFDAIEHRHAQVVIYQDEAKRLGILPQFALEVQPQAEVVDRRALAVQNEQRWVGRLRGEHLQKTRVGEALHRAIRPAVRRRVVAAGG